MDPELHPPDRLAPYRWTVLILRDVLGWPATDVAALLGVSAAELDRSLALARAATFDGHVDDRERAALARFIGSSDPAGVAVVRALLREHEPVRRAS
jgi:RNA polymerase sigma-70 factor, ECF subfamily